MRPDLAPYEGGGGTLPPYQPGGGDSVVARLSPGRSVTYADGIITCDRCRTAMTCVDVAEASWPTWLVTHPCEPDDDMIDEQRRAELPAVDTLDAHICPQCRRKDVKHISYVEPDLETWAATRDDVLGLIRDTVEIDPCECRIKLHHWGLRGYEYSDRWIAWEWRRA